jgi:hypothetical protein
MLLANRGPPWALTAERPVQNAYDFCDTIAATAQRMTSAQGPTADLLRHQTRDDADRGGYSACAPTARGRADQMGLGTCRKNAQTKEAIRPNRASPYVPHRHGHLA